MPKSLAKKKVNITYLNLHEIFKYHILSLPPVKKCLELLLVSKILLCWWYVMLATRLYKPLHSHYLCELYWELRKLLCQQSICCLTYRSILSLQSHIFSYVPVYTNSCLDTLLALPAWPLNWLGISVVVAANCMYWYISFVASLQYS